MSYTYQPLSVEIASDDPENEISWKKVNSTNVTYLANGRWQLSGELKHISNPATGDLRNRTQSLICTNFQITKLPEIISGLQFNINTQRNGRATDEVIQLTYQGQAIGKNNFVYKTDVEGHLKLDNNGVYGGPTDLWEADITPEILRDPSFGIILKFQSHPYYPHSCGMFVDSVLLTVF